MTTATLLAYVVAGVALVSAAGVVLSARTIYSALCLVGNMVSLAVLFLLLNAQFVAAVQIIIYAGAVMVLFVFIIALLDPGHDPDFEGPRRDPRLWVGIVAVGYITAQVFALAVNGITYSKADHVLQGQRLAQAANTSPPAAPMPARTRLSTSSCRASRQRGAPSASRTLSSCRRAVARAS